MAVMFFRIFSDASTCISDEIDSRDIIVAVLLTRTGTQSSLDTNILYMKKISDNKYYIIAKSYLICLHLSSILQKYYTNYAPFRGWG